MLAISLYTNFDNSHVGHPFRLSKKKKKTLTIMRLRRFPKIPNQPREGGNEI